MFLLKEHDNVVDVKEQNQLIIDKETDFIADTL